MANVNVKFNNKDYLLSCDDGHEKDLKNLKKFLDKKYSDLKSKLGNLGENKLYYNLNPSYWWVFWFKRFYLKK